MNPFKKTYRKENRVRKKSKGLGDTIEKTLEIFNIPSCKKCGKRKEKLNKMFPYK